MELKKLSDLFIGKLVVGTSNSAWRGLPKNVIAKIIDFNDDGVKVLPIGFKDKKENQELNVPKQLVGMEKFVEYLGDKNKVVTIGEPKSVTLNTVELLSDPIELTQDYAKLAEESLRLDSLTVGKDSTLGVRINNHLKNEKGEILGFSYLITKDLVNFVEGRNKAMYLTKSKDLWFLEVCKDEPVNWKWGVTINNVFKETEPKDAQGAVVIAGNTNFKSNLVVNDKYFELNGISPLEDVASDVTSLFYILKDKYSSIDTIIEEEEELVETESYAEEDWDDDVDW